MAWSKNGFYYRSYREGGKPKRRYLGRGLAAQLAAEADGVRNRQREHDRQAVRQQQQALEQFDVALRMLTSSCQRVAMSHLLLAGYRRDDGHQWRKRRCNTKHPC
jgi:hypothetical protein